MSTRIKQIAIALDCVANAILGGWSGETLSARCYRLRDSSKAWRTLGRILDFFFPGHCQAAYEKLRMDVYLPPEYRN